MIISIKGGNFAYLVMMFVGDGYLSTLGIHMEIQWEELQQTHMAIIYGYSGGINVSGGHLIP